MHLLIVGGGAAGLCAAITAKRKKKNLKVTILEANDRVGKKLITTGNGRCNITNKDLSATNYHGGTEVCYCLDNDFITDFFASIGTEIVFEETNKAYPASYQALSVVDNLRFACEELGVEILTGQKVTDISFGGGVFTAFAEKTFNADAVLICSGSAAGGKIASDSGYSLLKKFSHTVTPITPAIAPIKTETDVVRQLKGIKVNATAKLIVDGKPIREEYGEVLFCDYGLSGPPILQLARPAALPFKTALINLDLMPDTDKAVLIEKLHQRKSLLANRTAGEFFTGLLNKRLGQVICKLCGFGVNTPASELKVEKLAGLIKEMPFKVLGVMPLAQAQVAAGGVKTDEFNKNFMSKKQAGLFAAGEVLNIDGDCGGFNLAFAWCSGETSANAAVEYLEDKNAAR